MAADVALEIRGVVAVGLFEAWPVRSRRSPATPARRLAAFSRRSTRRSRERFIKDVQTD